MFVIRFVPLVQVNNTENVKCFENTVLFCLCSFLMINIAVAFATGPPHRSPMYTNRKFLALKISHPCVLDIYSGKLCSWEVQKWTVPMLIKRPTLFSYKLPDTNVV